MDESPENYTGINGCQEKGLGKKGEGLTTKKKLRFWGSDRNILYPDHGSCGYTTASVCQNLLDYTVKRVDFTVRKL